MANFIWLPFRLGNIFFSVFIVSALTLLSCSNEATYDASTDKEAKDAAREEAAFRARFQRLRSCVQNENRCLVVLSVATKNILPESYAWYTHSLKHFDYDFHIVGTDLNWGGWVTRGKAMKAAIEDLEKNFSEAEFKKIIILSSDTGDILVQRGPAQLLETYDKKIAELKSKYDDKLVTDDLMIVGGEFWCGEGNCEKGISAWYDRLGIKVEDRPFPHAQGGFLMGPATAAKRFYNYTVDFMTSKKNDDQLAMGNFAIEHPSYIYIDYLQELVATIIEHFPGEPAPPTGIDYSHTTLYEFAEKGIAHSADLQRRIGATDKVYPAFLHVVSNERRESVKQYWNRIIEHLKEKAWI